VRPRLSWVTTLFQTDLDTAGGTAAGQSLVDILDWDPAAAGSVRKQCIVRRIIVKFCWTYLIDFSAAETEQTSALISVMYKENVDEDSTSINTTAFGEILQEARVLYTNIQGVFISLTTDDSNHVQKFPPTHSIDWKGSIRLQPDERITLAHQLQSSLAGVLISDATNDVRAISRVLIEQP